MCGTILSKRAPYGPYRYTYVFRLVHWTIALLVILMLALGLGMELFPASSKLQALMLHKSIGIIVLLLTIVRLALRASIKNPAPIPMPAWIYYTSRAVHLGLYFLLISMPLSGWAMITAQGRFVSFFGLFNLPQLVARDHHLGVVFKHLHSYLSYVMLLLVTLHVLGVLYHQFIRKDGLIYRML